jgi:Origin recognition complex (ORC) subunit 5 C-terminus
MNLNLPRAFTFERLVAIFRAIHPSGVPGTRSVADRIAAEVAELERLRLLVRADAGTTTRGFGAAEDHGGAGEEARWRVNVPRAFVEALAGRFAGGGGGGGGGEGIGDVAKRGKLDGLLRDFELFDT